jgi:hypothetical protein
MKIKTAFYWITTTLIALETLMGGIADLSHGRTAIFSGPFVTDVVLGLGYPAYVLAIIGTFKVPGALALVLPGMRRLKEWAYAGIFFELLGAAASLWVCHQRFEVIVPLFLVGLALASWALRPPSRTLGAVSRPVDLTCRQATGGNAGLS